MGDAAVVPNFVIGGAPKCGTTSLCAWLADHPQARCSTPKEPFFLLDPEEWIKDRRFDIHRDGIEGYGKCFPAPPKAGEKILFEGTTLYLYQRTALATLAALPVRPKILFVLREPSRRIYSNYQYFANNKAEERDALGFRGWLEKVRAGETFGGNTQQTMSIEHSDYARWLEQWFAALGRENVKVWIFERLVRDPRGHMQELCRWLEIDPAFYDDYGFVSENSSYAVKNFWLHRLSLVFGPYIRNGALRRWLRSLYRRVNTDKLAAPRDDEQLALAELKAGMLPAVARLETLLGESIPEWR